jgi:hypothetical protein
MDITKSCIGKKSEFVVLRDGKYYFNYSTKCKLEYQEGGQFEISNGFNLNIESIQKIEGDNILVKIISNLPDVVEIEGFMNCTKKDENYMYIDEEHSFKSTVGELKKGYTTNKKGYSIPKFLKLKVGNMKATSDIQGL